ncbi:MAG: hypothetical protein Q7S50_02035 [bacterium]|nr:hypothetical protein [bacterium]
MQVKWKADYVASCTVTSTNNDSWSCLGGACSTEIIQTSKLINAQTVFTILCQGLEGSSPPSVTDSTTVNIVPIFNEQ